MKKTDSKCNCKHCQEIVGQQNRHEQWQLNRQKYNLFIESKALEVRPDLKTQTFS